MADETASNPRRRRRHLPPTGIDCWPSFRSELRGANVFGARSLGTLTGLERHRLAFAHAVERNADARGLMEEVFPTILPLNEAEALFTNQPLDLAVYC